MTPTEGGVNTPAAGQTDTAGITPFAPSDDGLAPRLYDTRQTGVKALPAPLAFPRPDGSTVTVSFHPTPGGLGYWATVRLNEAASAHIHRSAMSLGGVAGFEDDPAGFEHSVYASLFPQATNLPAAVAYAEAWAPEAIEVLGLVADADILTPTDGRVVEPAVLEHLFNLTAAYTAGANLESFAYRSENDGRLSRAVSANPALAYQPSSQGFAAPLPTHQDNADRWMPGLESPSQGRGSMNPYQAFATIHPDPAVPMWVLSLADAVADVQALHGKEVVEDLQTPSYAVSPPASHGKGASLEFVPLLRQDAQGRWHGRFHEGNVVALTERAERAFAAFRDTTSRTGSYLKWARPRGSLLLYSNTRCLHRRSAYEPSAGGHSRYFVRLYMRPIEANGEATRVLP